MKKIWIFAAAVLSLTLSCSREQGIKPSVSLTFDVEGFRKSVWTEETAYPVRIGTVPEITLITLRRK